MLLGYALALLGELTFTSADFVVKLLKDLPPYQISFFRSLQFMLFSYIYMQSFKIPYKMKETNKNILLLVVGLLGSLGLLFTYYGVQYLPMSEWMVIQQTSPIIISILAVFMLGEKFEKKQLITITTSMAGILLIAKPPFLFPGQPDNSGMLERLLGVVFSFGGAIIGSVVQILIKQLGKQNTIVIIFYFGLMGSLIFPIAIAVQGFEPITGTPMIIGLALVGLLTFMAQGLKNKSFLYGTAARISMMGYSSIIFSFLIDIFYFKYIPDSFSIIGSGLIICGIIVVILQNFTAKKPQPILLEKAPDSAVSIATSATDSVSPYDDKVESLLASEV